MLLQQGVSNDASLPALPHASGQSRRWAGSGWGTAGTCGQKCGNCVQHAEEGKDAAQRAEVQWYTGAAMQKSEDAWRWCSYVRVTCSASEALSLSGGLPKMAGQTSRWASLTVARELHMPLSCSPSCGLLLIVGTGSCK